MDKEKPVNTDDSGRLRERGHAGPYPERTNPMHLFVPQLDAPPASLDHKA